MNTLASPGNHPLVTMGWLGVPQSRVPGQGYDDAAAIHQIDTQGISRATPMFHLFTGRQVHIPDATFPAISSDAAE